ncbi:MAG: hypothetical protein H6581_21745 [Bacteroidia bacterium]|nr:hypothetical protein [Bacteroidia bacterium]
MTLKRIYLLLFLGLALFSCKDDDPQGPPYDYEGHWELQGANLASTKNSMAYRADINSVFAILSESGTKTVKRFSMNNYGVFTTEFEATLDFDPLLIAANVPATEGVIVAGTVESGGNTLIRIRAYDNSLTESWTSDYAGGNIFRPFDLTVLTDGGMSVSVRSLNDYDNYPNFSLYRCNSAGDTVWSKWSNSAQDDSYAVEAAPNGGTFVGLEKNGGVLGTGTPTLALLDPNGTKVWDTTYTTADDDLQFISDLKMTTSGDLVLVGETYKHGSILIRYDANGNEKWRKIGPKAGSIALSATPDDGVVVLGSSISEWIERQIEVWKMDASGNFEFTSTLGGPGTDNPGNIATLANGNYLLSGLTNGFGGTGESNFHTFYIRVNNEGEIMP